MFRHKNCNGTVVISLAKAVKIVSPGCVITTKGISPGAIEINQIERANSGFVCLKCGHDFDEKLTDLLVYCMACNEYHPVVNMLVNDFVLGLVCESCYKTITGTGPTDESIGTIREVLSLPKDIKFVPLLEVLLKPIRL